MVFANFLSEFFLVFGLSKRPPRSELLFVRFPKKIEGDVRCLAAVAHLFAVAGILRFYRDC